MACRRGRCRDTLSKSSRLNVAVALVVKLMRLRDDPA